VTTAQPKVDKADETAADAASPPELNAAAAHAKPRLLPKRASGLGRLHGGPKGQHEGQHVALQSRQASSGAANAKTRDRVALQPGTAQK
jgi:hypothetical protein